jgi:hypothetical protein
MANVFSNAPEVAGIARRLIGLHHTHLKNIRIDYVFRSESSSDGGKVVWASARKITGLNAFLATESDESFELQGDPDTDQFFCIEVWEDVWDRLKDEQKEALVDHELCHCWAEEACNAEGDSILKLKILPHDVEEFASVIQRHGLWKDDVKVFVEVGKKAMVDDVMRKGQELFDDYDRHDEMKIFSEEVDLMVDGIPMKIIVSLVDEGFLLKAIRKDDGQVFLETTFVNREEVLDWIKDCKVAGESPDTAKRSKRSKVKKAEVAAFAVVEGGPAPIEIDASIPTKRKCLSCNGSGENSFGEPDAPCGMCDGTGEIEVSE